MINIIVGFIFALGVSLGWFGVGAAPPHLLSFLMVWALFSGVVWMVRQ